MVIESTTQQPVQSVSDLLAGAGELPVLPEVALRIFDEMRSPRVTAARMAEFVKKDPVLASAVLRIANSALYGGRTRISDLAFAIARVGLNQIRNMLLAMVLRSKMADPKVYGNNGVQLMDHCLAVAFGAGLVSEAAGVEGGEAFMGGLLHDFGKLALIKALREQNEGENLSEEQLTLVDHWHSDAGEELARKWDLPEIVATVAKFHHRPGEAAEADRAMVAVVAFANTLAHKLGLGELAQSDLELLDHPSNQILGLGEEQITDLAEHLPGLFQTARSALLG